MVKKPTVISLFAGAGGMDLGFKQAGFDIIWANEFEEIFAQTYRKNIGGHIVVGDIKKIRNKDIPKKADIVIGGFPCQGFSIANNNRVSVGMKDERNHLYKEMLRVIRHVRPKFFVAENVKGILNMQRGAVMELIFNDFKKLGYSLEYKLLNAADYGVPQQRERVFIIGNRVKVKNPYPEQTHADFTKIQNGLFRRELNKRNLKPYISAKEAIGHLSNLWISLKPQKHKGKTVYNHMAYTNVSEKFWARKYPVPQEEICDYLKEWRAVAGISTKKVDEIFGYAHTAGHWFRKDNNSGSIPKPDDWKKLKEILGFDDRYDKNVLELELREIVFEQSLRISNWKTPSDTITATSPEIHVNRKRRLSARECAILQTFPDDFIFEGSLNAMIKQIGNAVPVLLSKKIARNIKRFI
ncbi:MAG: DNA (cytosine-5-)-methyltransferase [Candidatus Marinimicrobia bacterium]|nr:DNA (cytosine-5-)-methyltransferase [Candidatus Neomarinimicrobiota bacterium]